MFKYGIPALAAVILTFAAVAVPAECENPDHGRPPGATGWAERRAWAQNTPSRSAQIILGSPLLLDSE